MGGERGGGRGRGGGWVSSRAAAERGGELLGSKGALCCSRMRRSESIGQLGAAAGGPSQPPHLVDEQPALVAQLVEPGRGAQACGASSDNEHAHLPPRGGAGSGMGLPPDRQVNGGQCLGAFRLEQGSAPSLSRWLPCVRACALLGSCCDRARLPAPNYQIEPETGMRGAGGAELVCSSLRSLWRSKEAGAAFPGAFLGPGKKLARKGGREGGRL